MRTGIDLLTARQRALLRQWLPDATVLGDRSWGLVGTSVLELALGGRRYIVKAADADDHHLAREMRAHREWLQPWTSIGRAPSVEFVDPDAKILVTRYLPGELVQGTDDELAPDVYRQAGELLARFHAQLSVTDDDFEARSNDRTLAWLRRPHRVPEEATARILDLVGSWPTPPSTVVPTHGDWQPRNWLVHDGRVGIIDFGRADLRPAMTDFARLDAQQFKRDGALEAAFLDGYGVDPRKPAAWRRTRIREAVATAVWAHEVGDEQFERQGLRMIKEALADA